MHLARTHFEKNGDMNKKRTINKNPIIKKHWIIHGGYPKKATYGWLLLIHIGPLLESIKWYTVEARL